MKNNEHYNFTVVKYVCVFIRQQLNIYLSMCEFVRVNTSHIYREIKIQELSV